MKTLMLFATTIVGFSSNSFATARWSPCHLAIIESIDAAREEMVADEMYRRSLQNEGAYPVLQASAKQTLADAKDRASLLRDATLKICVDIK